MRKRTTVSDQRGYAVRDVAAAKQIAASLIQDYQLTEAVEFGLPEVDDRYHIWRVPLLSRDTGKRVGEVVIDAETSLVLLPRTTARDVLEARLLHREAISIRPRAPDSYLPSTLRNTVALGDCEIVLREAPAGSVDLLFTSPPYYNARVEYSEYLSYSEYLLKLRKVIQAAHHVLADGRFFVINTSPVLVRRTSRSESSKRIAVPFDIHAILVDEGFDFVDDIIWVKPEGAGWATGRGRRFAADRNPLQYKAVPVTEYVLVYRKRTSKLIDWHIRSLDSETLEASKIGDDYERTNVWKITPATNAEHPAVFPLELAERVIRYYSFKGDVVLDPFAGSGTVGRAAVKLGRRFFLIEKDPKYVDYIRKEVPKWLGRAAEQVMWLNAPPADHEGFLL